MIAIDTPGTHVHLVGIKGAGMTGLAQLLKGLGYIVSGSDIADSFFTDAILQKEGIPYATTFDATNISQEVAWAVSSSAYLATDNQEIKEIERRGIPLVSYPEALGYFFNQAFGIAITGTHGKSTTAAMIAYILEQAGRDPFALIGAELLNWHSNARIATSHTLQATSYFVIEADEYREQFLNYKPNVLVITNIDYDHSDYFPTRDAYQMAFTKCKQLLKPQGILIEPPLDERQPRFTLAIPGVHNQQNARIAYQTCHALGIPHDEILKALASFKGIKRRLETIGEYNKAVVIDDYAHHPQEVIASLNALRQAHPDKKLIVLFHPHTYSRTQAFLKEFAQALSLADEVYLLDIYASARESKGEVNSQDIVEELQAIGRDARNLETIPKATAYFKEYLKKGDLLVTMGAGDVFRVAEQLIKLKS